MASLQIPAGHLSERYGAAAILAGGTALAGFGYCLAGLSGGFTMLLIALLVGGLGASAQHPIASALVARAFSGPRSLKALGGYNFAGDIGKMTVPALASLDACRDAVASCTDHPRRRRLRCRLADPAADPAVHAGGQGIRSEG